MDQEMRTDTEGTAWPELSADLNLARSSSRSITLDTHRASADGRVLEVAAQLDLLRTRLSSLEQHVFDASSDVSVSEDVLDRFSALESEVASTSSNFEGLATRVAAAEESVATTMMSSVDGFDSRLGVVEDSRLAQANELNELTGYLEQAFTRISELALLIEEERGANASSRAESFNQFSSATGEIDDKIHQLFDAVDALNSQLDQASTSIDESTAIVSAALEARVDDMDDRLSAAQQKIDTVDEVSTTIQFLTSRADALEAAQLTTSGHLIDEVDAHRGRLDKNETDLADLRTQITSADDSSAVPRSEIEHIKDVIDAQAEITAEHGRSHQSTTDTIAANSAIIDTNTADIAAHAERIDDIDGAREQIGDALDSQASILESHTQILDAATGSLESLTETASAQAESITTHEELLAETTELIGDHALVIADHSEQLEELRRASSEDSEGAVAEAHLAEHAESVAQALTAADKANQAAHDASDRIGSLSETAELISQRVDLADATTEDFRDRLVSTESAVTDASTKLTDLDGSVVELSARVENAAAALEAANARIDEAESTAFDARSAVDGQRSAAGEQLDQRAAELHGRIDDTVERLDGRHDETGVRLNELAEHNDHRTDEVHGRVDETFERLDGLRDDVSRTQEQLGTIEGLVHELGTERTNDDGQVNIEAISAVQDQVSDLRGVIHSTSERIDSTNDHISSTEQLLDVTRDHMRAWIEESNTASAEMADAVRQDLVQSESRLSAIDTELNERILSVEAGSAGQARVDVLEATLATVEQDARGAHSLAENLRMIQTEIVSTLQAELQAHTSQLEHHAQQLRDVNSTDQFASADRVHMLESKIVEALQTISQLTQLQRRTTSVETQLTDTLTSMSQGVEHTQQHVVALRGDLDGALQRIGQLEAAVQSISVAPAQPPASAPATAPAVTQVAPAEQWPEVAPEASIAEPLADAVIDDLNELSDDEDTDTGWFTESYARKNAS